MFDKVDCKIEYDENAPVLVIIILFAVLTDNTKLKPVEVKAVTIAAFIAVNKVDVDEEFCCVMVALYEMPFNMKRRTFENFEDLILGNPLGISAFLIYIFLIFLYF